MKKALLLACISALCAVSALAQTLLPVSRERNAIYDYVPVDTTEQWVPLSILEGVLDEDSTMTATQAEVVTPFRGYLLRPAVFDKYHLQDSLSLGSLPGVDVPAWISEDAVRNELVSRARQQYMINNPASVRYIEAWLPEPPREFTATVDPETARIVLAEVIPQTVNVAPELEVKIGKIHWLKKFNANLQFSQAYVSPNWYQGGNNNLNALANIYYNVKLNQAFHPNWLYENTLQYKLGANNAPDDKLRDYSISEDLFQWNMTVGYKSTKRWYYSLTSQFKTQFLNSWKSGTNTLKSAFLSPGELNVGIGMTYGYANPKKTFTFDASISPFSWNMKTCVSRRMDVESFGIKPGRKTVNEIGSSAEGKLSWQMCDNISLRSRLFVFTDYTYLQSDFENTIMFTVNRFLTTQIYVHCRYDSTTKRIPDSDWRKFQLKEILSFGFTYAFSTAG